MFDAAREKTRLWLLILVGVVTTLLGQTHAREIFAPVPEASGVFATQIQATTGDFYDADRYDVPDWLLAANTGAKAIPNPNTATGVGFGVNDPAARIQGPWTKSDLFNGLYGRSPKGLGRPDLHHAEQMPGSAIHEIEPSLHRGNSALHPNKFNQGVTDQMRMQDRQLHWWYRAREQGAEQLYPDHIYD